MKPVPIRVRCAICQLVHPRNLEGVWLDDGQVVTVPGGPVIPVDPVNRVAQLCGQVCSGKFMDGVRADGTQGYLRRPYDLERGRRFLDSLPDDRQQEPPAPRARFTQERQNIPGRMNSPRTPLGGAAYRGTRQGSAGAGQNLADRK